MSKKQRYEDIGARIREAREELELSQSELAEEVGYASPTAISLIESGQRKVSIEDLERISDVLETPIEFFLGKEEPAVDLNVALRADKDLTPSDREKIMDFVQFVRGKRSGKSKK